MALSSFDDKNSPPTKTGLETALGRSYQHWTGLIAWLDGHLGPIKETWQFSGIKWGWNLKIQQRKRAILYLTPQEKSFLVGFALGEKAVKAAVEAGLPDETLEIINEAPRYAEGRGVRLPVRNKAQVEAVKLVAKAKMET